jgi:hypothetical protein
VCVGAGGYFEIQIWICGRVGDVGWVGVHFRENLAALSDHTQVATVGEGVGNELTELKPIEFCGKS